MRRIINQLLRILISTSALLIIAPTTAHAASIPSSDFSLEVSPSPLVADVKPGQKRVLDLKIRNASFAREDLKIEVRSFTIAHPSEQITISTTTPPDLASWVSFSSPSFSVDPAEWYTQKVTINLPEQAGFSYPFVLVVSRQNDPSKTAGGASIKGSIAVFALINIDRPGATRKLELEHIKTDQNIYEFLPSKISVKLKNTGNSIVQPYGNIYVERPGQTASPLTVLPVNDTRSYMLPGSSKELTATWSDGFPVYAETTGKDGKTSRELQWNWANLANIRFGQYTARVVTVYNDGTRDVPITGEVTFWVVPWRILAVLLVLVVVIGFGIWSIVRKFSHLFRRTPKS